MEDSDLCRGPLDVLLSIATIVGLFALAALVVSNEGAFLRSCGVASFMGPTGGDAVSLRCMVVLR